MEDDTKPKTIIEMWDTRAVIALSLTLSMIVLTFVLALKGPETDAFKVLLGAMLTVGFTSVIGWYFASSSGSDKKDAMQAKVAEKLAEKVPSAGPVVAAPETVITTTPTDPSTTPTTTTVTTTEPGKG